MSQNNVNYADNPTGPQLMDNYLAKSQENNLTTNSGVQRPTYAKAGTFWINSSANPWVLYFYNGSTDVAIGTIGTGSSGTFSVEGVDLSNYVTTNTQQNITNTKTFKADQRYTCSVSTADFTQQATTRENWFGIRYVDKNNLQGGLYQYFRNSDGSAECNMQVRALSTNSFTKIMVRQNADGTGYVELSSTPATSDNSNKAATTKYVKNQGYATSSTLNSTISSSPYLVLYGTSTSAADATAKIVEISSSYATTPTISAGQILIVTPTITSTVANSTITLEKSSTTLLAAKTMRYNNANITTSTDSIVWRANVPSIFIYDGTYWVFAGHGCDENTTYQTMSVAEGIAGTATSNRVMRADYLAQILEGKGYIGSDDLATVDVVTEYSLGTKGYIKFSNNFIIQWGITTSASQNTSITLPTPFTNTNYSVNITSMGDAGVYQRLVSVSTARTTTKFTTYTSGGANSLNFSWMAMGY